MKYISVEDFIKETIGKEYDIDKKYGVQCVDGIKKFVQDIYGESDFTCGNGWAYGLWTNYGHNGVEKYFKQYSYKEAKKGDWIIWNKGSKSAPNSHVAMFINEKSRELVNCYGQSQNGKKAFNESPLWTDGILGVLRPNIYLGYCKGQANEDIRKIDNFLSEKVKGNYYGDYTEACVKAFQKQNELFITGIIDSETLEAMIEDGLNL